jgi:hypothetical protein
MLTFQTSPPPPRPLTFGIQMQGPMSLQFLGFKTDEEWE